MKLEVVDLLIGEQREEAWELYYKAFKELNARTIQRHLLHRSEFDDVAGDFRVQKWMAVGDDGVLHGLATYTNDLAAWPLISPAYFERNWPQQYAAGSIWYCGFVATDEDLGVFPALVGAMYKAVDPQGVIAIDFCDHNARLARVVAAQMRRWSDGKCVSTAASTQTFWTYQLP